MKFPIAMPHENHEATQNLPVTQLLTNSLALPQPVNTAHIRR